MDSKVCKQCKKRTPIVLFRGEQRRGKKKGLYWYDYPRCKFCEGRFK